MDRDEEEKLRRRLAALKLEHRRIDEDIEQMIANMESDQLKISRLKKQKLSLKDEIRQIENRLLPDIIA